MKRIIFTSMLLFVLNSSGDAQNSQKKEDKYKWGCAIVINSTGPQINEPEWNSWGYAKGNFFNYGDIKNKSISLSLIPKYHISNDKLIRLELGLTKVNLQSKVDSYFESSVKPPPSSHTVINQSIKQNILRFIPGIEWTFLNKSKIKSYCGLSLAYLNYGNMSYHDLYEIRKLDGDTLQVSIDDNMVAPGGFATGAGAFAGFNIGIIKNVSIGAEFSSLLLYYKLGGGFKGEVITIDVPKPPANETYSTNSSSFKGVQFTHVISSFNVLFSF